MNPQSKLIRQQLWQACVIFLLSVSSAAGYSRAQAPSNSGPVAYASLPDNQRALLDASMNLGDDRYDPVAHLLRAPGAKTTSPERQVRESCWYAVGLLERDQPGDRARATDVLDAVLGQQYLDPHVRWYGTFRRTPDEPLPPLAGTSHDPSMIGFDPNWREFIGTTFELILMEFPESISAPLRKRMEEAADIAAIAELNDGHVPPSYTNIALLYGALLDFSTKRHPELKAQSNAWNEAVYGLYKAHNSFAEYNSPTYSGTDLVALALWRRYGSTERMRAIGTEMEDSLWAGTAEFYSLPLRNIVGPYDRSYGMDMESYVSVMGVWISTLVSTAQSPLPPISNKANHVLDIYEAPTIILLGARMPASARSKFERFSGPHLVNQKIDDLRTATAWVAADAGWGAEATSHTIDTVPHHTQFHPVTVQWRTPAGKIGWIQLVASPAIDAVADEKGVTIDAVGDISFRILAAGMSAAQVDAKQWNLPGLHVIVRSDEKSFSAPDANFEVSYKGVTHMRLDLSPTSK